MFPKGDVLIQKFGGSSVASAERIKKMALRVAEHAQKGKRVVLVISAMGNTTDDLINLMKQVSLSPERTEIDCMMATGEMVSASLAASALRELGIKARSFNAFNLHLLTKKVGDDYTIVEIGRRGVLARFLEPGAVAVIAGFQGISVHGDLTTLGRGGSDLTAVIVARELGQKVCEKYTDEDGIYTADPRIVSKAVKVWHLNYDEMLLLAAYGNGILHPRAISIARENDIRIHVRSSFTKAEGSVIGPDGDELLPVKSIACDKSFAIATVKSANSIERTFFYQLAHQNFDSGLMQLDNKNGKMSISVGFNKKDAFEAMPFFWEQASMLDAEDVIMHSNIATLTIVGEGLNKTDAKKYFQALINNGIKTVLSQYKGMRLSFSVEKDRIHFAFKVLHDALCDSV